MRQRWSPGNRSGEAMRLALSSFDQRVARLFEEPDPLRGARIVCLVEADPVDRLGELAVAVRLLCPCFDQLSDRGFDDPGAQQRALAWRRPLVPECVVQLFSPGRPLPAAAARVDHVAERRAGPAPLFRLRRAPPAAVVVVRAVRREPVGEVVGGQQLVSPPQLLPRVAGRPCAGEGWLAPAHRVPPLPAPSRSPGPGASGAAIGAADAPNHALSTAGISRNAFRSRGLVIEHAPFPQRRLDDVVRLLAVPLDGRWSRRPRPRATVPPRAVAWGSSPPFFCTRPRPIAPVSGSHAALP